ncbi:MAG: hypothetical protein ABI999_00975 [Acidobacteriota bacterium]
MKKHFSLCLSILVVVCGIGSSIAHAQTDGEKFIKASSFLEKKPLDKTAKDLRAWAITYLANTAEVRFAICSSDLTKPLMDKTGKYSSEIFAQYTIGMAAFKLANPEKKADENAAQLAGFLSALAVYKVFVKLDPKAKDPGMNDLLSKREKGNLPELINTIGCGKN